MPIDKKLTVKMNELRTDKKKEVYIDNVELIIHLSINFSNGKTY